MNRIEMITAFAEIAKKKYVGEEAYIAELVIYISQLEIRLAKLESLSHAPVAFPIERLDALDKRLAAIEKLLP